mmetsp:Transcript_6565/g.17843  ORF Transcript_6565/g.17843 Transcript_6565/m.17843 type:complete len:204 (+) Transcript_6565:474-1085(+)
MLTQVSVTTTSAPFTASAATVVVEMTPPFSAASCFVFSKISAFGSYPVGVAMLTLMPILAQPSMRSCRTLLPSPTHAKVLPSKSAPKCCCNAMMSAKVWSGWCKSESALMMGTVEYLASSSMSLCENTRAKTNELNLARTEAVSRMDSLTPSWMSDGPRNRACPPSSAMPVSVDTRVRVDLFWKIMLTESPSSGFGFGLDLSL